MADADIHSQGFVAERSDPERFEAGVLAAVEYRGDITMTTRDGGIIEGYVFDLTGTLETGSIGYMTREDKSPQRMDAVEIERIEFSGKDTAEGKSFETWIEKYVQKKIAGERASIECESLDD